MKITLDVDCTPEEARTFLGLPDLSGVNRTIADELERRTKDNLDTLADPQAFWDRAVTSGVSGMEAFGKMFAQASRDVAAKDASKG